MKRCERARYDDGGFTLIELMVVVLIIAILLAVAIPTFLGARQRAKNRAVQSNLRNALTNELVVYSDNQGFTADTAFLRANDASLQYTNTRATMATTEGLIYVEVSGSGNDTVVLGAMAPGAGCFWIRTVGETDQPRFAQNDCLNVPVAFVDSW